MIVHRAAWVLPIAADPLQNGWVATDAGRIVALGGASTRPPAAARSLERTQEVILPGLVNAHTHLELSWLRGEVPPCDSMPAWVDRLITSRRAVTRQPPGPIAAGVGEVKDAGTAVVGDVANTPDAWEPLARSGLEGWVFRELLGFNVADGGKLVADAMAEIHTLECTPRLRWSVVPHAPFSTSPALLRAIAAAAGDRVVSVHVGESSEEIDLLRSGGGAWRQLLERLGAWDPAWTAPRCGPVEYLDSLGLVNDRLLVVHGVHLTDSELLRLAEAGSTVVTCPRSNRWTGAGDPPVGRFYASGVRVAVGTDSLASAPDLNLFSELAALHTLAPEVPASRLLESATRAGAEALGFGERFGTIEPGKEAALIAVRIPAGVRDVEEYLVTGIAPADIRWIDAGARGASTSGSGP